MSPRPDIEEQYDRHCVMNVGWRPWRIQSILDGRYMVVVSESGQTRTADLGLQNWNEYCDAAAAWLRDECARLLAREEKARRQRAREDAWRLRQAQDFHLRLMAHGRLLASGYGPIDDLEDEVLLADLEFTDPKPILAVDCQTTHLESLAA